MGTRSLPNSIASAVWRLAAVQHGVIARWQLLDLGMHRQAIQRRIASGRLHRVAPGVFAVGRPELTREGGWMAAVLASGPAAILSHLSAAALWGFARERGWIDVSLPISSRRRHPRARLHRRNPGFFGTHATRHRDIPVTTPILTLIDIAPLLTEQQLERAINEADKLGLCTPDEIRAALADHRGRRGVAKLRMILDRHSFTLTESQLEILFKPIARRAGLADFETQVKLNGYDVDFYWADLGLVVETDGLTYHRTPAAQARDQLRDQAHLAAGLTVVRFTHFRVKYEPRYVEETLRAIAARLRDARAA